MKGFLLIALVLVLQSVSAQVTANATASATIVNTVGTEAISNDDLQFVSRPMIQQENNLSVFIPNNKSMQIDVAKFSVVNSTSLYTFTVQPNELQGPINYVYASKRQYAVTIKPLQGTAKAESFVLDARIDTGSFSPDKYANTALDIIIHFN